MNKYVKLLTDREFRFWVLSKYGVYNWMSDEEHIRRKYLYRFGAEINLENPRTYNEKLQWLKLHDRRQEYTRIVDKLEVKKYVEEHIGEGFVIPVIGGPWDSFDEIDFDRLPHQFVLKTTHDCGGVYVCHDKDLLDRNSARKFLNKHLKRNYYVTCREWPYKNVKPRIFAEAYVKDSRDGGEELTDYKFFCFDGVPKAMFVATDRSSQVEETKFDFFDMDFAHLPIIQGHPNANIEIAKPYAFERMKEIAGKLSRGFPQLRVDFYCTEEHVYVGELTLFHFGGFVPFEPEEWDAKFGEWIQLPDLIM